MPNDYFQFKKFVVKQDNCAMKVCTDACLFGAWVAAQNSKLKAQSCLDIGAGTGLLSLMLAQKLPDAIFDAVEIDEAAAQQAKENFDASPWKERLNIHHTSIQEFASSAINKYDVIISNPPFYENDLKSANSKRNLALHSDELSLEELISAVDVSLKEDGSFFCLLPFHRTKYFEEFVAKNNLNVKEKMLVKQTSKHNFFRTMFWIDRTATECNQSEIIIMNERNEYSNEFINLLKNYYLHL